MEPKNMNDESYTNRELYLIIQANHADTMKEIAFIKTQVGEVKEQTTKTNGTCKDLTKRTELLENWRSGIVAGIALLAFAIPLAISALK